MAGKVYKKATDPTYKEGRKEKSVPKFLEFFEKTKKGELSVSESCRLLGISRSKWYKLCREAS